MKYYRYCGEREGSSIKETGEIRGRRPKDVGEKFFTPDYWLYSGTTAQAYLSLWYKPNWRVGPIEVAGREPGDIAEPRRIWPAFGQHGGGWEFKLKFPFPLTDDEKGSIEQIDLPIKKIDDYKALEYFDITKATSIHNAINTIAVELGFEPGPYEIKDGGFVNLLARRVQGYPDRFTISITYNVELNCLCCWVSAWTDWDEFQPKNNLGGLICPSTLWLSCPAVEIRKPKPPKINLVPEFPPVREFVIWGPKAIEEPAETDEQSWQPIISALTPILTKAKAVNFANADPNWEPIVRTPGSRLVLPSLFDEADAKLL